MTTENQQALKDEYDTLREEILHCFDETRDDEIRVRMREIKRLLSENN
jgi:hypothetical protein